MQYRYYRLGLSECQVPRGSYDQSLKTTSSPLPSPLLASNSLLRLPFSSLTALFLLPSLPYQQHSSIRLNSLPWLPGTLRRVQNRPVRARPSSHPEIEAYQAQPSHIHPTSYASFSSESRGNYTPRSLPRYWWGCSRVVCSAPSPMTPQPKGNPCLSMESSIVVSMMEDDITEWGSLVHRHRWQKFRACFFKARVQTIQNSLFPQPFKIFRSSTVSTIFRI